MSFVVGRGEDDGRPSAPLGWYRARDGSRGAALSLDLDAPHATLIVGKRGYGKSYTTGVIAEGLARTPGVAPVVVDPMGTFDGLADRAEGDPVPASVVDPAVAPAALDPRSWCALLGLSPESAAGALVWQAATDAETLPAMLDAVEAADAPAADRRAAANHLRLADSWGVFDPDGLDAAALAGPEATVVDVSGLDAAPAGAVLRGIGEALYAARVEGAVERLPWLLVDEAHAFFGGVAEATLELLLTRGRAPGVSLLLTTQRPSAVSAVAVSQADLLIAHRLTSAADLDALAAAQPTYVSGTLDERLPTDPGEVVIVDDATETVHAARIRSRDTPHGGESPRASDVTPDA